MCVNLIVIVMCNNLETLWESQVRESNSDPRFPEELTATLPSFTDDVTHKYHFQVRHEQKKVTKETVRTFSQRSKESSGHDTWLGTLGTLGTLGSPCGKI